MIVMGISVFLLACICMALEHRIETLSKYVTKSTKGIQEFEKISSEITKFQSESIGKLTTIAEATQRSIDDLYKRVDDVSHETKDIKSYYCNYITKKGNE